jgi:hypothetical protein
MSAQTCFHEDKNRQVSKTRPSRTPNREPSQNRGEREPLVAVDERVP